MQEARDGAMRTVSAVGEIDLATAPTLDSTIDAALAAGCGVVVDLSAVTFVDSMGIRTLLRGRRRADELHTSFSVTGATDAVRTVLEMTGLWEHLSTPSPTGS